MYDSVRKPVRIPTAPRGLTTMDIHHFESATLNRRSLSRSLCSTLALITALAASSLTGCGFGAANTSGTPVSMTTIAGKVHGGVQPVVGATVQVWAVGNAGYGSAATPVGSSATTGSDGSFTLNAYANCPTPGSLVYITATGGNPGNGSNNAALKLASALGPCGNLTASTFIWINEVTTAATAYALAQYFTPTFGSGSTDSFGAPNTTQAQTGIANAFTTVNNMVSTSTGNAVTSASLTSGVGTITATAESAKLNTIADILSACVNSDGSNTSPCATTLFPAVTPTGGVQPTDTLQAAVDMNLNPTSNNAGGSSANLAALYSLQSATPPYVGVATQPTDWTYGINYSAGTDTANQLINTAIDIGVDSVGNIWVIGLPSNTAAESLSEFTNNGTPVSIAISGSTAAPTGLGAASPRNLAIDTNNNVYVTTSSGSSYLYQYSSAGVLTALNVGGQGYGMTIDGNNNVWIAHNSGSAITSLDEFLAGTIASTSRVEYPLLTGSTNTLLSTYAAISTSGSVWMASGTSTNIVYQASGMNGGATCTTFPCTTSNDSSLAVTYTQASAGGVSTPWGVAAAPGGNMWLANSGGNSIALYTSPTSFTDFGSSATLNAPRKLAVDGAGNVWVANRGVAALAEFSPNGTVLSPTGFPHSGLSTSSGISIDPSGNVWVSNNTSGTSANAPNSIFELVGAAAPTVTPVALALKNNAVGQRP
ncbi:MAG: hypothetical protein V4555_07865 [Acidobacteriota bacterium]